MEEGHPAAASKTTPAWKLNAAQRLTVSEKSTISKQSSGAGSDESIGYKYVLNLLSASIALINRVFVVSHRRKVLRASLYLSKLSKYTLFVLIFAQRALRVISRVFIFAHHELRIISRVLIFAQGHFTRNFSL